MKSVKVKSALTVVTFGIKVPAGLFIPSMVTGAISGMKSIFEKSLLKFRKNCFFGPKIVIFGFYLNEIFLKTNNFSKFESKLVRMGSTAYFE